MKLQEWKLSEWFALIWCAVLGTIALLGIYPGFEKSWSWATNNASNIASWVQAIGSIAAIWGAFRIANLQVLDARNREINATKAAGEAKSEDKRQEKRRKYMLLYDRFHSCTTMVAAVDKNSLQEKVEIEIAIIAVNDLLAQINNITIDQIPDLELVVDVSNFRIRLEVLKYQLLKCAESLNSGIDHESMCAFVLEAVQYVVEWGNASRKICEKRLRSCSTHIELAELDSHFKVLKASFAGMKSGMPR